MKKILVAEDDPTTQKILLKFIEKMGHVAFVSPNGKHAYQALYAANNFDLLVTDMMMPEMDGRELIRLIKEDNSLNTMPIIIISAILSISDISDILELGATFFLSKPVKRNEFVEYIQRCLK